MSDPRYPIPADAACAELTVLGSRFIADAAYTPEVVAARAQIAVARAAMPDASHHCYAYLIGYGASVVAGMGDDGEPGCTVHVSGGISMAQTHLEVPPLPQQGEGDRG
ncbi:MAG: YigZ family protein [Oscillochloridaceae bacterium umkhey_bin13]